MNMRQEYNAMVKNVRTTFAKVCTELKLKEQHIMQEIDLRYNAHKVREYTYAMC